MPDWHPEDIKATVRKRGATLTSVGAKYGLCRQVMANVLAKPHAAAETAIAEFLNVDPQIIWPSRYHSNGCRKKPQPTANYQSAPRFAESEASAQR